MKRKNFLTLVSGGSVGILTGVSGITSPYIYGVRKKREQIPSHFSADVIIAGGGLGGCAAAIAACRNGLKVIMTEETDWIGGQVSQQGVPPDEHQWIETHGATKLYRDFRNLIRNPSLEKAGPRVYPPLDRLGAAVAPPSPWGIVAILELLQGRATTCGSYRFAIGDPTHPAVCKTGSGRSPAKGQHEETRMTHWTPIGSPCDIVWLAAFPVGTRQ